MSGNCLLKLYKPSGVKLPGGQPDGQRIFVRDLWAKPQTLSGMAAIRSAEQGMDIAPVRYSWRVNFRPEITDAMSVDYLGVTYDIKQVRHDLERKQYTYLVCETGGNRG